MSYRFVDSFRAGPGPARKEKGINIFWKKKHFILEQHKIIIKQKDNNILI